MTLNHTALSRQRDNDFRLSEISLNSRDDRAPFREPMSRRDDFPRGRTVPAGIVKETSLTRQDFRTRIRPDTWKLFHYVTRTDVHVAVPARPGRGALAPSDAVLRLSNCLASSFLCFSLDPPPSPVTTDRLLVECCGGTG